MTLASAVQKWYQKELLSIMKEEEYWLEHLPGWWEMTFEGKKYRCQPFNPLLTGRWNRDVFIQIDEIKPIQQIHVKIDDEGNVNAVD